MHAFHEGAARQLDEDRVAHRAVLNQGNVGCLTIPAGSPEDNRAHMGQEGSCSRPSTPRAECHTIGLLQRTQLAPIDFISGLAFACLAKRLFLLCFLNVSLK